MSHGSPHEESGATACESLERKLGEIVGEVTTIQPWLPEAGGQADAMPRLPMANPSTEAQAQELLRLAALDDLRVLVRGAGSKLAFEAPRTGASFLIGTERLHGVIAFEPADGTLTAFCGTPMAELAELAASGGRRVTPHLASTNATLGGAIATAETGPDRLRYGPIRDKLLGLRALLAADNSSKSGGRLVKNVAGYDLHRAHCGGRGSFGLILEATVRLHPALPVELHLHRPVDGLQDGHALATRILASAARPLAVRLVEERDQTTLRVHLGGREDVVQHEQHLLRAICGELVEGPPHVNRSPLLRVDSMRSRALAASLWAGETRAGLELDTTLIADPGIAMTQLVPLQETTHRLALGALSALPERTHLVIPAAGSAVAAPVARLGEAVARALDPAEIFARANF